MDNEKEQQIENQEEKKDFHKKKVLDIVFISVLSTIIALMLCHILLFSFVFINVEVSGSSMTPTLNGGDILIANKTKQVERGDIIIVSGLQQEGHWLIKRAIGVEGDTVVIENGNVYLNGNLLEENYLAEDERTFAPNCSNEKDIIRQTYIIGEDEIFFLGDNRNDSLDSRHYGVCKEENVKGVVTQFFVNLKHITTPMGRFTIKIRTFFGIEGYGDRVNAIS